MRYIGQKVGLECQAKEFGHYPTANKEINIK
jgi:hypothetical protein